MNETINKFLLAGGKCMAEMHLRFTYSVHLLLKTNNEYKNLKKQNTQNLFTTTN